MTRNRILVALAIVAALAIGYGTAYAQGIRIQFLGPWMISDGGLGTSRHGAYRIQDGPNTCYVAVGVESIAISCMR